MKKKHLISAIIWFAGAFGWLVLLIGNINFRESISMITMYGILAVLSLISAILNIIQYRKNKK